jgi:predicted secreted protein
MAIVTILADNGVSSGTSGLKTSGGNDGTLALQSTNSAGTALTGLTIDNNQNVSLPNSLSSVNTFGFKNRIINGNMVIDQRNAGASVTVNSAARTFGVDRFFGYGQSTDGVFTITQDSSAPAGFTNSTKIVVTTADASVGANQYYLLGQSIEGYNVADLGFGAAGASTVTISFWVKSSLTGSFGGSLQNGIADRSYPFSYTINAANTWEQKTVTIAGETTGTWAKNASIGMQVFWDLGCGSSNISTANSWAAAGYYGVTGSTKLISTLSANMYITGVQIEKGTQATSFDFRSYGTELALCRRYFRKLTGTAGTPLSCQGPQYLDANTIYFSYQADLGDMRASPTAALVGTANTDYAVYNSPFAQQTGFTINAVAYTNFGGVQFQTSKTSHGQTNNPQVFFGTVTTTGALTLSSEL